MATPTWSAPRSGLLGDTGAVNASVQINQLLGAHAITAVYQGNSILTPNGHGGTAWQYHLDAYDVAQPFTMSGTTIGRVAVPLLPVGTGADLIVSLCANNSGVPGSVITQTRIPASWITSLAAVYGVAGPSSSAPLLQYTNSPLALGQYNSFYQGTPVQGSYAIPAASAGGPASGAMNTAYGSYEIFVGGGSGSSTVNAVYTIFMDGNGNISPAVPQPQLVANNDGTCGLVVGADSTDPTTLYVVMSGGATTIGGAATNNVYTAAFSPTTGTISSWSSQAVLPQALQNHVMAAWNGYVYSLGGNTGTTAVYYAQLQNGQITAWNTANPLPQGANNLYATAINGFLFAIGGGTTTSTSVYYAPIRVDGSLGAWRNGPSLPSYVWTGIPALNGGTYGIVAQVSNILMMLGVSANGPDTAWQVSNDPASGLFSNLVAGGAGSWQFYTIYGPNYVSAPVSLTPRISVPLPATGLSNGATYFVTLSQPGGDLNDYLRTHDDFDVFPGLPTLLTRSKTSTTWTAGTANHAVPIQVFDNSAIGKLWHLWEDNGARVSTMAWGTTPNQPLLGLLEATAQPGPVLNMNPTFTRGLAPWNVFGGSAATSNAFTHGGLPLSAKITPTGSASLSYIESDKVPAPPGHSFLVSAWFYSPVGYNNVGVSVNWFTSAGSYISSTTASNITIPANTWTLIQGTVTNNVANATQVDMVSIEGGTPPATAVFYVSAATIQDASGPQLASVLKYDYNGTWPSPAMWPPTGTTVLA